MNPRALSPWWGLALAGAAYLLVALPLLSLPGPFQDELLQVLPGLQLARGSLPESWPTVVEIGGRPFPIMSFPYIGALKSYLTAPLWLFSSPSMEALRAFTALLGLGGLAATFMLARQLFGSTVALVGTLLLATDASYVLAFKHDAGPVVLAFLLRVGLLLAFIRWWSDRRARWLALCGLLAGLGLWNKLDFAWILIALLPAGVWLLAGRRVSVNPTAVFMASTLVGAAPLVWFNLASGGATLREILVGLDPVGHTGDLARLTINALTGPWLHLPERLGTLASLLDGGAMPQAILNEPPTLHGLGGVAALIAAGWFAFRGSARERLLLAFAALLLLLSAALGNTNKIHHLFYLYPAPHMLTGMLLARLLTSDRAKLAAAAFVLMLASNAIVIGAYYARLQSSGGSGFWSDALYDLSAQVQAADCGPRLVTVDWGIDLPVGFLSNDRCRAELLYSRLEEEMPGVEASGLPRLLGRPDVLFAVAQDWVTPTYGVGRSRGRFRDALRDTPDLRGDEQLFYQRDGMPVASLIRTESFPGWFRFLAEGGQAFPPAPIRGRLDAVARAIDFREGSAEAQLGPGWYPLEAPGPFAFRWTSAHATAYLHAPGAQRLQVAGEFSPQAPPDQVLTVLANGRPVGVVPAAAGPFEQSFAVVLTGQAYVEVELQVAPTFVPGNGDRRGLGVMIRRLIPE